LQECFETPLKARKSLVNDFEQQFNLSCEIAGMGVGRWGIGEMGKWGNGELGGRVMGGDIA
jgi:hypothetical protein